MFCHGRGRGFESRRPRHSFQALPEKEWESCLNLCRNRRFWHLQLAHRALSAWPRLVRDAICRQLKFQRGRIRNLLLLYCHGCFFAYLPLSSAVACCTWVWVLCWSTPLVDTPKRMLPTAPTKNSGNWKWFHQRGSARREDVARRGSVPSPTIIPDIVVNEFLNMNPPRRKSTPGSSLECLRGRKIPGVLRKVSGVSLPRNSEAELQFAFCYEIRTSATHTPPANSTGPLHFGLLGP